MANSNPSSLSCTKCSPGNYVSSSNQCSSCSTVLVGCLECEQDGSKCTKCDDNKNLEESETQCKCQSAHYFNSAEQKCISCGNLSAHCQQCEGDPISLSLGSGAFECTQCADGYFAEGTLCKECSFVSVGCVVCQQDGSACVTCDDSLHF